jgi:hypothetical protein
MIQPQLEKECAERLHREARNARGRRKLPQAGQHAVIGRALLWRKLLVIILCVQLHGLLQLFLEYAKENGRKLRYILNFLPFMMQSFDYLIFLNVIVLGYEALPSRLYFKTIVVELILWMV